MSHSEFNFPDQTIPESKKDELWHIEHALSHMRSRRAVSYSNQKQEIEKLYRAYLCVLNDEEESKIKVPVTAPHGIEMGQEYQIYNLIEQKIEQMVGDYLDRPLRKKAYVLNKGAQIRKLDAKIKAMSEQVIRELNEKFKQEYGVEIESPNPEMEIPEDVETFFAKDYRDAAEEVSDDLIEKFLTVDKQKELIAELLKDFLISERAHLRVVEEDGIVKWRKGHPLDVDCDLDPTKVVQDDHEFYIETHYLTENEIYNTYELTKAQKNQIKTDFAILESYKNQKLSDASGFEILNTKSWYLDSNNSFRIAVVDMMWKSRKVLRAKVVEDPENPEKEQYIMMGEKDRLRKGEKERVSELEMPRHVVMAGPSVCLSWGLEEHRNYRVANKKKCYLDSVSIYRQNTIGASAIRSVAAKLYKMQTWASEILYELRLAMRKNNGKVMVYDTAQTPSAYFKKNKTGVSPLNSVMHHIKTDQIVYINSKEKNNRYAFNQFTSIDLSNSGQINDLINGLAMIEDLADRMIGLTEGRQGNAGQYATATNVEAQRKASFSKTEVYYRPFDNFLQACMERVLMKSKQVYKKGDTLHYVLGDLRSKFVQIMPEFMDSDIGLYFGDASKDLRKKEIIDRAAEATLGNAQTPEMIGSLIDILCEDTAVESKAILDRTIKVLADREEERAKAEQEAIARAEEQEAADKKADRDLTKRGQDKDVLVAQIYADQKQAQIEEQQRGLKEIKLADIEAQNIDQLNSTQKPQDNGKPVSND